MVVFIMEPDPPLADFLQRTLEAEGHNTILARDIDTARRIIGELAYDLALLDSDLEQLPAVDFVRMARTARPQASTMVLISSHLVEDRIEVLDSGADDCLLKPFSVSELCARVRAVLRRSRTPIDPVLRVADLELDRIERKVARCGRSIELTPKEFALLEFMMRNAGAPVPRGAIFEHVWNLRVDTDTNVVDVYINYLRKKVDEGFSPRLIQTVRGVGYRLAETPTVQPS